jgi:hypothetical protein
VADEVGIHEYHLTAAGKDLKVVVESFGIWGQKWVETQASLENLDPSLLMWDMRRNINPEPLPSQRTVIQFRYPELPVNRRDWWLIIDSQAIAEVDLCVKDPGFDVDLWVTTDLKTMTAIWMGLSSVSESQSKIFVDGDPALARSMTQWLGFSHFAAQEKIVG